MVLSGSKVLFVSSVRSISAPFFHRARGGLREGRGVIESVNSIAERLIDSVDWAEYKVSVGPATKVGVALCALLSSSDISEASAAWNEIEEFVFSQGTIYSAAEPTVSVMLAALTEDQPSWRSGRILDLVFFIVKRCVCYGSFATAQMPESYTRGALAACTVGPYS